MKNKQDPKTPKKNVQNNQAQTAQIRQTSQYNDTDHPAPDNNLFWENNSNPLSSKGN